MIRATTNAPCALGRRRVCVPLGPTIGVVRGRKRESQARPNEADLPAEEAASREGARVPRPDEDHRGPSCPGCSSREGSQASDGLTTGAGPERARLVMLSRPRDFEALQREGAMRSNALMTARIRRTDLDTTRFGLSTGRKLGGAVIRNRARRRLREALRVMAPSFQPGWDVLIIARPALVEADHEALVGSLRRLLERAGVLGGQATT